MRSELNQDGDAVAREVLIDEDLYALLMDHAESAHETANEVLRRLLPGDSSMLRLKTAAPQTGVGDLMPFLIAGLMAPGDELRYEQPKKQLVHHGTVTASGCVSAAGHHFRKVSPALKALTGHEVSGWTSWMHAPSGRLLADLRQELRRGPARRAATSALASTDVPGPPAGAGWAVNVSSELREVDDQFLVVARGRARADRAERSRRGRGAAAPDLDDEGVRLSNR